MELISKLNYDTCQIIKHYTNNNIYIVDEDHYYGNNDNCVLVNNTISNELLLDVNILIEGVGKNNGN